MKLFGAALLLFCSELAALTTGQRYDFLCTDGQDIFNAELTAEDEKNYFVRLSPVMQQVPIEKKFVAQIIPRSVKKDTASPKIAGRFEVNFSAGADLAVARLANFSRVAPRISVAFGWWFKTPYGIFTRISAEEFRKSPAYLRAFSATAGAAYQLKLPWVAFSIVFELGAGGALLNAKSDTFSETTLVPAALLATRGNYAFNPRLRAFLEISANYIYDRDTLLLLPGAGLGVAYAW